MVYPRVYGESGGCIIRCEPWSGLSPRVRGIRTLHSLRVFREGSIPACTGNPCRVVIADIPPRVYPRVYGESQRAIVRLIRFGGLSPRVRGIPGRVVSHRLQQRSIPACTGNPRPNVYAEPFFGVYPRVYGESFRAHALRQGLGGLSPRVRGIQTPCVASSTRAGSIPACTGNPRTRRA